MVPSFLRMGLSFLCWFYLYFTYVGVLGKIEFNTYQTPLETAVTKHIPRVIAKTCLLKPDVGPCRGSIRMYYYNVHEKNCTKFHWGGCQGNGNRFDRFSECVSTCLSTPNMPQKRPKFCSLTFDYGYCFGAVTRWYYDKYWKVCKTTLYSGCGGNHNNFYSFEECDSVCRLGKGWVREKTIESGGTKKILIINPPNTTPPRGKDQGLAVIRSRSDSSNAIDTKTALRTSYVDHPQTKENRSIHP